MKPSQVALRVLTVDAPRSTLEVVRSSRLQHERVIIVSNGSCDAADAEMQERMRNATLVPVVAFLSCGTTPRDCPPQVRCKRA